MMLEKLVIATHNLKKSGEMVTILQQRFPNLEILTLGNYEEAPEPEETGATYSENAVIKAESAAQFTNEWCLADDAGLEIDALAGAPGIYSRRFEGEDTPFTVKMERILERMELLPPEGRTARFRCCVALARPGYSTRTFEAICEGRIAEQPSGAGGFGYDPIFYLPELGCTMADLSSAQKHSVSHRGKVLKLLGDFFDREPVALP